LNITSISGLARHMRQTTCRVLGFTLAV
jgi:hypothetical protein